MGVIMDKGQRKNFPCLSVFTTRSRYIVKFLLLIFLILVLLLYCEFLSYWILPLTWINKPNCASPHCKKILLVSDPQLIASEWKSSFLLDTLAIWDSDRYLKRTFLQAVNFILPDLIVFLGDLTDQGHISTDPEFESYIERFKKVFELPNPSKHAKIIFLPGDNDIGGEDDIVIPGRVHRFDITFNQTEGCDLVDFIEFCKVNLMTSVMQESKFINSNNIIRVVLSHVPLTPKHSYFLKEVIKKIRPILIFSGHFHISSHFTAYENDVWSYKQNAITPQETRPKIYKFHEGFIHEILVPTASYRMGVPNMGYGAAFIDNKKQWVSYMVLWLPNRFRQIYIYFMAVILLLVVLVKKIKKCKQFHFRNSNKLLISNA